MAPHYKLISITLTAIVLGSTAGCESTTTGGAVGANRQQLLLVSSQQLDQMAAQAYSKLSAESAKKGTLNTDAALTRRVRAIASRITPQTRAFRADAPGWKWEVNTITSNELNAFCMPGGKIMFYSGLVNRLGLSDDEIAIVMGHEIAHALREHARARMGKSAATNLAVGIGSALFGLGSGGQYVANMGAQLVSLKFGRDDESEADKIGLDLAARAGYDPQASVRLWQKMATANKGAPPQWLSTHPAGATRIKDLQANIPDVENLYARADKPRQRFEPAKRSAPKTEAADTNQNVPTREEK